MPSQNGIVGDDNLSPEPAQSPVVEEGKQELKRASTFIKSQEYAELKEYLLRRIEFYGNYLPDGQAIAAAKMTNEEKLSKWDSATAIIQEFRSVINAYEAAAQQENATGTVQ